MALLAVVCLIVAIVLFLIAAFYSPPSPRPAIGWLGLAFLAAALLFEKWPF
jgi:hypothetical protein